MWMMAYEWMGADLEFRVIGRTIDDFDGKYPVEGEKYTGELGF